MAPSLRTQGTERLVTILRRLRSNTRGLGYWSAVDALKHLDAGLRVSTLKQLATEKISVPGYEYVR